MQRTPFDRKLVVAALLGTVATTQALAQSVGTLEEIIVTAEKRATTVQDTPLAVTAFSGEELDRALISKPLDL